MAKGLEDWNTQKIAEAVYWVEAVKGRRAQRISLAATPVDIGPILREHLFGKVPTVITTSATLATAGKFDFFQSRVGLTQTASLSLGSPFNYQEQAELVLLDGMPDPGGEAIALRAGGGGNDSPLRGADRRPGVRALHQLRIDEAGRGGAFARGSSSGTWPSTARPTARRGRR